MVELWKESDGKVKKPKRPKYQSRARRLDDAKGIISDAKAQVQELLDEVENWSSNLPENLQSSNKGVMLEEAIDNLTEIVDSLDQAESIDVEFPGMYS